MNTIDNRSWTGDCGPRPTSLGSDTVRSSAKTRGVRPFTPTRSRVRHAPDLSRRGPLT